MSMRSLLKSVKKLDAYPKVNEDFFTRTFSGGLITILSSIFMAILFISEAVDFRKVQVVNELGVDRSRGEQMQINVDITLHRLGCSHFSIDVMDVSGDYHLHVDDHEILKQRLDWEGNRIQVKPHKSEVGPEIKPHVNETAEGEEEGSKNGTDTSRLCLSCYGAEEKEGQCCNTCDEVRDAYRRRGWALGQSKNVVQCKHDVYLESLEEQKNEGCHVHGQLQVNKVAGNFHIAPGKSFQQGRVHMHDLIPFGDNRNFNMSHTIHKLSFGHDYPGSKNPLDEVSMVSHASSLAYKYFVKVVPTLYIDLNKKVISTNQFSVTEHTQGTNFGTSSDLPGLFFYYELSPIKVMFKEHRVLFLHFVTNVCAIVGGVFTVSGIIDGLFYHTSKLIRKKMEIGKYM